MKEWTDISKEYPPLPKKEAEDSLSMVRMKRKLIFGASDSSHRVYHDTHYPDNIYEGKIVWRHSIGYCFQVPVLDFFYSGEYLYLTLESMSHWEREIFTPIDTRFEILDL